MDRSGVHVRSPVGRGWYGDFVCAFLIFCIGCGAFSVSDDLSNCTRGRLKASLYI
ncbi:hypothetical protein NEIMUCOT_04169 [Neisseria mucosa ATCC 25996]|uniref:Uncharacterized protein n=1 Tax=Neisseria mucosa (strain ATCC 25996 / DSM 4631 / NCTC 10774 / M26) TaxID=546266 RepID=D2ZU82_NEIM2|nr:hypothetical protein NEIMUCOT_04169 [Neisseria mucosa ATCC 25996]